MAFDLKRYQDPLTIQRVLHSAKTVAVLGLSSNHLRPSYFVAFYLKRHGYTMIPVNPKESEILGEKCYKSLAEIPVPVDIVDVFRAPDALPGIAKEAVAIGAKCLWCQCFACPTSSTCACCPSRRSNPFPLPTWPGTRPSASSRSSRSSPPIGLPTRTFVWGTCAP